MHYKYTYLTTLWPEGGRVTFYLYNYYYTNNYTRILLYMFVIIILFLLCPSIGCI